jgi:hypothetical protein
MNAEPFFSPVPTSPPQSEAVASTPAADGPPLPDDVTVLKAMIRELLATLQQTQHERDGVQQRLDVLLRKLYGPKAERFDPNQPWLLPELAPTAAAGEPAMATAPVANVTAATAKAPVPGHGRKPLPKELRRERVEHTLSEAERICPCCGLVCQKFVLG